jgi:hypothetical protein
MRSYSFLVWLQEHPEACLRCREVVTDGVQMSPELRLAADPTTPVPASEPP